ncbi:MAG TPA: CPBP family intramembrane glutamic endopeptidase [Vicinamibacterales bacterium]|nr:CPBP family intramembrane glutamic endopeptidase [Vicinamibacterales bacterium]
MRYTAAIAAIILGYTWVAAPLVSVRGPWLVLPVGLVIALAIAHNRRTHDWGFSAKAFWPALAWSALLTAIFGGILWWAGRQLGPPPHRDAPLLDFLYVMVWGGAQQFVLQTVILREAQSAARRVAVLLAATIFATFHLPNPFLVIVTFTGGLIWCAIYTRYPNIVPLALSHATATVIILTSFNPSVTNALRTGWRYFR